MIPACESDAAEMLDILVPTKAVQITEAEVALNASTRHAPAVEDLVRRDERNSHDPFVPRAASWFHMGGLCEWLAFGRISHPGASMLGRALGS